MRPDSHYTNSTHLAFGCNFLGPHSYSPFVINLILYPGLPNYFCATCEWDVNFKLCKMKLIESHLSTGYSCFWSIHQSLQKMKLDIKISDIKLHHFQISTHSISYNTSCHLLQVLPGRPTTL